MKMIITCPKCKTRLKIPDERIGAGATRFRCSKCNTLLQYRKRKLGEPSKVNPGIKPASHMKSAVPIDAASSASFGQAPDVLIKTRTNPEAGKGSDGISTSGVNSLSDSENKDKPAGNIGDPDETGSGNAGPSPEDIVRAQEMYKRYGFMAAEKERIEETSFMSHLPRAFSYPFKSGGLLMLSIGAVFITIVLFFSKYAFMFGIIGYAFVGGYLASFMMKIISHSADGEINLPDWPDLSEWWDDILSPMFRMIAVTIVSYFPLLLYLAYSLWTRNYSTPVMVALLVLCTLYQPMALLAMSMLGSVAALNPIHMLPAIFRVPGDYLIACLIFLVLFFMKGVFHFLVAIPILGPFLDNFIMLYLLTVEMRILGLIYYSNKEKLAWF